MKRFAIAIALMCIFSGSVIAGDIPSVPGPPPPPPVTSPADTEGEMGTGGFAEMITEEIAIAIFNIFAR